MEPTPIQMLEHLFQLALEASAPAKVHQMSKKAFEDLKKILEEQNEKTSKPAHVKNS